MSGDEPSDDQGGRRPRRRSGGRSRWIMAGIGVAVAAVLAGGASVAVELTGSSASPRTPPPTHTVAPPRHTAAPSPTHTARPTPPPKPKPKPTPSLKPRPTPTRTTARAYEPTPAPATAPAQEQQPTAPSTYQQDCYAPPNPTCTVPPPPSSLTG